MQLGQTEQKENINLSDRLLSFLQTFRLLYLPAPDIAYGLSAYEGFSQTTLFPTRCPLVSRNMVN